MPINLKGGTGIWALAAVLLLAVILLFSLLGWTVEWLWMGELGYRQVFWRIRLTEGAMFLTAFVLAVAYFGANGVALHRIVQAMPAPARMPWQVPGAAVQAPGWAARAAMVFLPVIGALIAGAIFSRSWDDYLRFAFAQSFGRAEPVLGHDAGFYVFTLPFLDDIQNFLVLIATVGTGLHLLTYHQNGLLRAWKTLEADFRQRVLVVLAANAVLFMLAWGWGYYLDRFHLLYESGGAVYGPGYTDVTVVLPALAVMVGASAALAVVVVAGAWRNRMQWPLIGTVGFVVLAALALLGAPALFQQFVVRPNELQLETPYLKNNIDFTRWAFSLDRVQERSYPAVTDLTLDQIRDNTDTLENVRLWDWRPLLQTYRQMQEIRLYYEFYNVDVDRYMLDGRLRQVLLSSRELGRLPSQSDTWVNRVLQYTHGYGLAMSLAAHDDTAGEGVPRFVVKDLPPATWGGLKVDRPAIYFGEKMPGYRIVNTGIEEFDYPRGDANVYVRYAGRGGVLLSSYWRRLLFAWNRFDVNILISSYITPKSRIQIWRDVAERVNKIAPFLKLDGDPYLVVGGGRLYWIQDAYTTSESFPYSEPYQSGPNYIRNSVKVVVDAYEGSVDFYVVDGADPILRAYRTAFPGLFKPLSAMPADLKAHLRFPRDLFNAQVDKYMRYHMTIPQVFYNNEDLWTLSEEKYGGKLAPMHPYYILMRLPDEPRLQFLLMIPLTPQTKDNMIAWMAARSDYPGLGDLIVYKFPKERLIYGPLQVEAMIDQDTVISRQLSLWDQRGSRVIRGNMFVIPIDHSILYVEPVYLMAETNDLPQLKRVIVAHGSRIAMEPTLNEALKAVFGGGVGPPSGPAATAATAATGAAPSSDVLGRVRDGIARAEAALKRGDWRAFGDAMEEVKRLVGTDGAASD